MGKYYKVYTPKAQGSITKPLSNKKDAWKIAKVFYDSTITITIEGDNHNQGRIIGGYKNGLKYEY